MDHVAIDLSGRESKICIRRPNNDVDLERRIPTAKLKAFFKTLEPSRVILETCAEAFAVARDAKAAGQRTCRSRDPRACARRRPARHQDRRPRCAMPQRSLRPHGPRLCAHPHPPLARHEGRLHRARRLGPLANAPREQRPRLDAWTDTYCGLRRHGHLPDARPGVLRGDQGRAPALHRAAAHRDRRPHRAGRACDDELNLIATQNDDCVRVMTVPGVGPATAVRFVAALDGVVRFRTAHEVESYFGLTPGEHSSSDTKRRTGLTKAGSAAVRWLLVQAAWTALRTRPNDPMVLWARRMTERKTNRFVAVVALARKIAGVMYALLRDKAEYQAQRASTARADDTPTVVAAGAAVTALARPVPSEAARGEPGPDTPPRQLAKTRAPAPTPNVGSAGWGMVGEESPTPVLEARATSPRRRRTATAPD